MPDNWYARRPANVLSDESEEKIHACAVDLLETLGVRTDCDEALGVLSRAGVRCDRQTRRAHPTGDDVAAALKTVGRGYRAHYHGTAAERPPLQINPQTVHTISGGASIKMIAPDGYPIATREDLLNMIALHERLDNVHVLINPVEPEEMNGPDMYPQIAADLMCYSSKPLLLQANGREDLGRIIRMGALLAGGRDALRDRPVFMTGSNAEPPMRIAREGAEVLIDAARAGVPVSIGAYLMGGATGPLDVAGEVVQRTATVLCGLVLTQAAAPGAQYDFSCQSGWSAPATGDCITISPRVMQLVSANIQMGRHYGLVTQSLAATESKAADAQASAERVFSLMGSAMAGASLIHGVTAEMSGMELASFAQTALDDELAGYVLEFVAGVDTGELDEAVSSIRDVVGDPQYASFGHLGHPFTAERCRRETYRPDLFSAGMLSRYLAGERAGLLEKADRRARELMADRAMCVDEKLAAELYAIAGEGRKS